MSKSLDKKLRIIRQLRNRDGNECFYCGLDLGSSITIEHLLPVSHNGPNDPHNLCLAHEPCNQLAADLPVVAKVLLREEMRRRLAQAA